MEEEYGALLANQTRDLVPRPSGRNVVTAKWIWTHKRRADGSFERYKALCVLRGCNEQLGVDYDETFSPVVKLAEGLLTDKTRIHLRSASVRTYTFFTTRFPRFLSIRGARGLLALNQVLI
jgi:hypothetical protein